MKLPASTWLRTTQTVGRVAKGLRALTVAFYRALNDIVLD
jgi:hypothetical protein